MRVLKFGGTSLGDGRRIRHVARLVRRAARGHRIVVVASAMAGVTDRLCSLIDDAVAGRPVDQAVDTFERRHVAVLKSLDPTHGRLAIGATNRWIIELCRNLREVSLCGTCPGHIRDRIMATGERLSVEVLTAVLKTLGCPARVVDGSKVVVTDDRFSEARIDFRATRLACAGLREKPAVEVPVVTGFIGADSNGRTTTLGRGGSDFSAAILGAALDAERVEIWTDVDGVLAAPPRIVANASRISRLSFEEAAELSHFGASVLHRHTVEPLATRGIPIVVRNTLDPSRPGTEIGPGTPSTARVAAITAIREVAVLNVTRISERPSTAAQPALLLGPEDEILMACSASSDGGVLIAASAEKVAKLAHRLAQAAEVEVTDHGSASVVALVGHRLGSQPWVVGRALEALGRCGLTVRAVASGTSPHAVTLLVERHELEAVLTTVHTALRLDGGLRHELPVGVINTELSADEVATDQQSARHRRAS